MARSCAFLSNVSLEYLTVIPSVAAAVVRMLNRGQRSLPDGDSVYNKHGTLRDRARDHETNESERLEER